MSQSPRTQRSSRRSARSLHQQSSDPIYTERDFELRNQQDAISVEEKLARIPCIGCSYAFFMLGLLLIIPGAILLANTTDERMNGWKQSYCKLLNTTRDNECVYFHVVAYDNSVQKHDELCAVPALLSLDFSDAPACSKVTQFLANDPLERTLLGYWQSLEMVHNTTMVACMIPDNALAANKCDAAATRHGRVASVYRAWRTRFVYLTHNKEDGYRAIDAATSPNMHLAVTLVVMGSLFAAIAILCFGWKQLFMCVYFVKSASSQYLQQRQAARDNSSKRS